MDASSPLDHDLDLFGQQPGLQIYTQIALVYPLEDIDASAHDTITQNLKKGLERLSKSFPWVAGQVVCEGASQGDTGTFKIKHLDAAPTMTVRDHTGDASVPTLAELTAAQFPFRMLDESKIAPRNTIPGTSGEQVSGFPCFLMQVNFIKGGLILTFNAQHQTMDMIGQESVMRWLSKACRGETFTEDELKVGNMPRRDLAPLLDNEDIESHVEPTLIAKIEDAAESAPPPEPAKMSWTSFAFSREAQAELKNAAATTLPSNCKFVSTDDALTAFAWQSIVRARLQRHTPETPCKTSRAVDVRRFFNVPSTYPGMFQNLVYHSNKMGELAAAPLGIIAAEMRAAVDPQTSQLVQNTQKFLATLARTKDKSTVSYTAGFNLDTDIMLSSWIKMDCTDMDFGLGLGAPTTVRRPQFIPVEGLGYFLPRAKDGEVVFGICLKDIDLQRLSKDEEFMKYAKHFP